jgi:hypothetical protein
MMREVREHRLTRISLALAVAIWASSLAAASDNPTEYRAAGDLPPRASSEPKLLSRLDYLVLASMADSMQPFTMAGYRDSGAGDGAVAGGNNAPNPFGYPTNKRNLQCHL